MASVVTVGMIRVRAGLRQVAIAALALGAASCLHTPRATIVATEYRFVPGVVDARGHTVRLVLHNVGHSSHAITIDGWPQKLIVPPGGRGVMTVRLPPGTYRFRCHLNLHDSLGMVGTLVMRP